MGHGRDGFRDRQEYRFRMVRLAHRPDYGASRPGPADRLRIGIILGRLRYPGWTFALADLHRHDAMIAFRSDPAEPKRLQQLGPWPLPEDAGDDEVAAVARAAVIGVDGEGAAERFSIAAARNRREGEHFDRLKSHGK
jgi:hypothetical protein